ncbi:hypothetical protein PHYBOEH_009248 [Phytophthora boehmeriae]|uniref:PexRD2 WYL domain-containing protein n=1 Tax=Phytophthora boehmeriae TaxID=109152 RepID=A0A8T1VZA8_9STRA|nr:hypothetical protein PHYBOEH_009248 [Phytophthora boehmeriae]
MRLSHVLVVTAAAFLVTSEALSTTTHSDQIKLSGIEVTSHRGQSQRLLRTHHVTDIDDEDDVNDEEDEMDEDDRDDDDDEDEERALTMAKMWQMKGDKMSAQGYAEKLGIWNKMNSNMRPGEYQQFLRTHRYQKYKTYFNFLQENK